MLDISIEYNRNNYLRQSKSKLHVMMIKLELVIVWLYVVLKYIHNLDFDF